MRGKKLKGDMSIIWGSNFKSEGRGSLSQKCHLSCIRQWGGGVVGEDSYWQQKWYVSWETGLA